MGQPVYNMSSAGIVAFVFLSVVAACALAAIEVEQCPGKNFDKLSERIVVEPCKKLPCRLRQNRNATITILFTPETELPELKTRVTADVEALGGLNLPFVGVDGQSACNKVVVASDPSKPAGCPLQPGVEYLYTDTFKVEPFYPRVSVRVYYALASPKGDIICFQMPAKITS